MSIEVGLWKLGDRLQPVEFTRLNSENRLETVLADDIKVIDPDLLLMVRQVPTAFGKFIDLLALDSEGSACGHRVEEGPHASGSRGAAPRLRIVGARA